MIDNPLDWPAEPFLALYIGLAVAVFAIGLLLRTAIGPARAPRQALNALEWAYLAGGASRVGDVALLCLASNSGGAINAATQKIAVTDLTPLRALFGSLPRLEFQPEMSRQAFQSAIAPLVGKVRSRLQDIGYAPTGAELASFRFPFLLFVGLLLALGTAKTIVGAGRHHPVGFLVFLLALTAFAGVALASRPLVTRAGRAALRSHQTSNARSARAPLENELLLAVALSGAVVLSGTPFAPIYAASRATGDGGGGDGGGGCGGGGCGGCS